MHKLSHPGLLVQYLKQRMKKKLFAITSILKSYKPDAVSHTKKNIEISKQII